MNEPRAAELGLADAPRDRAAWIEILVANPVLIQRPILLADDGLAALGRTPEAVRALLEDRPTGNPAHPG